MQQDYPNVPNAWGAVDGGPVSGALDPSPAEAHSAAASSVPMCDEGIAPVSSFPQSQSILTGLVPPAPGSSIGTFSSSFSVLSDPDFIDSFLTQVHNDDICNISMDVDVHDSSNILSNNCSDNGQNGHEHDTQSEVNISNDGNNELRSNSIVSRSYLVIRLLVVGPG